MFNLPDYPSFKYAHPGLGKISRGRLIATLILLFALPVAFFTVPPLALPLIIAALLVFFVRPKKLYLGPRYLLCGPDIVYYGNITRLTFSGPEGSLGLQTANGKVFVLDREKFPTHARKPDKVKNNKAAKFAKVSAKIIEKVRMQAPTAELIGVPTEA